MDRLGHNLFKATYRKDRVDQGSRSPTLRFRKCDQMHAKYKETC